MLTEENSTGMPVSIGHRSRNGSPTECLLALAGRVAAVSHLVGSRIERLERGIRVFLRRGETDLSENVEVEGVLAVRRC